MVKRTKTKKTTVQVKPKGYAYITVTVNNTLLTITNLMKETIVWSSAGKVGFKGSKKSTSYAAIQAAKDCAKRAFDQGVREVIVCIKGLGAAREHTIRALGDSGLKILAIQDFTPQPHNGCRPPKKRNL